ncbi:isoaspartyl peptidase/L-asparaginase family protein [Roseateles amylovorans]|uniref:Isoaspartyl peptidase/L-asparaginase n=1 Tax=Roseateles amylovorans TaxID=2978473 RepID=A0ABY6ATY9_9BURK|nr:isoaspartyl peptidase/L-asparaginase [Roseateles amylovorans]UXH76403.1 isoaspartyl peptidase/L-asparaginase [Roseateles amylovorans]
MTPAQPLSHPVLAIHGGAGTLLRSGMSPEMEAQYRAALQAILEDGGRALARGATAMEVVTEAVRRLEENELFNAGKGAVFTADARHELDASVMDGRTRAAGAVAGVRRLRNPILAARAVMTHSGHVMLVGEAAEAFAESHGLETVAPDWFDTPQRHAQLLKARELARGQMLDHDGQAAVAGLAADRSAQAPSQLRSPSPGAITGPIDEQTKFGTVGAVACDANGHLAAATSTGGMTNKRPGRVGDSPIIGAGCYADDRSVAVSCTGTGEAFMRACAAHEVSALMRHAGLSLADACQRVVFEELALVDGDGGLIAVDAGGQVWMGFNTEGMYRGAVRPGEAPVVGIYRDE